MGIIKNYTETQHLVELIRKGDYIEFVYINGQGVKDMRKAVVGNLYYGSNEYHKEEQFLLSAFDVDKKAMRSFAVRDMSSVSIYKVG